MLNLGKRNKRLYFHIAFLSLFLLTVLVVDYLHTERTLQETDNCPACQFLRSSLTTSQINFFFLAPLVWSSYLDPISEVESSFIIVILPASRSPPSF
ncbi:hypothetical protein NLC35_02785 [Candidatus Aminicenantes bacterium AC-334-K16]|jgi:hypothetical protein|nr:hypothetical protein [Candidatus Aminicenantes bacterium AC-334-K16]